MATRVKTGGRKAGTLNKDRKDLLEMLNEKYPNYNPVLSMADIANNKKLDIQLRFQANKEVAKYVSPQLKSVEMKEVLTAIPDTDFSRYTKEDLIELLNRCTKGGQSLPPMIIVQSPIDKKRIEQV